MTMTYQASRNKAVDRTRHRGRLRSRPRLEGLEDRLVLTGKPTITNLNLSVPHPVYGQTETLTATVAALSQGSGSPSGTVTFKDGSTLLGTAQLSSGAATLKTTALSVGNHSLRAVYGGDGVNWVGSTSAAVNRSSLITTVAGNGAAGFSGDNGPATGAEFNGPAGVAVDAAGNVFISDSLNSRVREVVKATGQIVTVAGNGIRGFSGDNGPATNAELDSPAGLALDAAGNLYIAAEFNYRVREVVKATGTIITVAGNGSFHYSGDNGPATSAGISPIGVAVDAVGNLFITDNANSRIREVVKATGKIITVAGNGIEGFAGDNGPAIAAELDHPIGIAVDAAGNLCFADNGNNRIREVVKATGKIITVAGNGIFDYRGDNGPATSAELRWPWGVAVDAAGNLFIEDTYSHRIREVLKATGTIITVAGNGTKSYSGDNGPASAAGLNYPVGLTVDAAGNIVIADTGNNRVRQVSGAMAFTVTQASTTTSVSASLNPSAHGQSVKFTAKVAVKSPGSGIPTGTVTFKDGTTNLGSGILSTANGVTTATYTTSVLSAGAHAITASYSGDSNDLASAAPALSLSVSKDNTTTSIAATPAKFAQPETLTATVHVSAPGAGTPTGTVSFKDGTTVLGTSTLSTSNGVTTATFTTPVLSIGTHSITASYGGDSNDLASDSAALTIVPVWNKTFSVGAWSTAWAAGTDLVFQQAGNLTVLDPGAGTVNTIKVGTWSTEWTVGNYVALASGANVTVVNLVTGAQKTLSVGAWSTAWTVGNYLALASGAKVTVVNLAGPTMKTFNVGAWSTAWAASGDLVFQEGGNLVVIDPAASTMTTFKVGTWSTEWTVGNYVALASGANITVANLATGAQKTLNVGSWSTAWTVGNYLALASGAKVTVVSLAGPTMKTYNVGNWSTAWATGGDLVFQEGGNLVVLDPSAATVNTFNVGTWSTEWTIGSYVALASGNNVTVVNLVTGAKKTLSVGAWSMAWAAGSDIVFEQGRNLTVVDLGAATVKTFIVGTWSTEWTVGDYVALGSGSNVTVVNLVTGAENTVNVGTWSTAWKLGNFLAFASGSKVTVLDLA